VVRGGKVAVSVSAAALLAAAIGASGAAAKTKVFSSGPVNMPIPDAVGNFGTGVSSNITIKKRGTVKDIDVAVRVTHPDTTDLTLDLFRGPHGSALLVEAYPKDGAAQSPDFGAGAPACQGALFTVFDDAAPVSITQGVNPFSGSFRPEQLLRDFKGAPLRGKWSLGLLDGTTTDAGTLNCWQLRIRYKPAPRKKKH
jgi:subtilisin-like proprotein convertase family protein